VTTRPRLLDLYSGAGGAARGYQMAGFHVTGVDIKPQPNYCGDGFHQADALTFPLDGYDAIHASPPCQAYTRLRAIHGKDHPDLLPPTRDRLTGLTVPWVIENVPGAPMRNYVQFCGQALGLKVRRHRWFESNVPLFGVPCSHVGELVGVYGHGQFFWDRGERSWRNIRKAQAEAAMGIDWMNREELSQAVPPAMTAHLGGFLLAHLERREGAAG